MVWTNTFLLRYEKSFILYLGTKQEPVWLLTFSLWGIITSGVRFLGLNSTLLRGSPWASYFYLPGSGQRILECNIKTIYKVWAGSKNVTRGCAASRGWFCWVSLPPWNLKGQMEEPFTWRQRELSKEMRTMILDVRCAVILLCFCRGGCWGRNCLPSGL